MPGLESRLDKLYPGLSALERALVVLRAFKEDGEYPRQVRHSMPGHQVGEFNNYIDLMNAVNGDFWLYVNILSLLVEELKTRCAWLVTLKCWGLHASLVENYLIHQTKEPITKSEYALKLKQARERMRPVSELAELLADRHEWAPEDLEDGSEDVTDAAYERVLAEKERERAELVASGKLEGGGKGRRLRVKLGAFYDWLREEAPVRSEEGSRYEVLPDTWDFVVKDMKRWRSDVMGTMRVFPLRFAEGLPAEKGKGDDLSWDEAAYGMADLVRASIAMRWQEVRAAEMVLEEAKDEFGGEEVARADILAELSSAKEALEKLARDMKFFGGPVELQEPAEKTVENSMRLLERALEVF